MKLLVKKFYNFRIRVSYVNHTHYNPGDSGIDLFLS